MAIYLLKFICKFAVHNKLTTDLIEHFKGVSMRSPIALF